MKFLLLFFTFSYSCALHQQISTNDIKELRKELFITREYDKYARPIPESDGLKVFIAFSLIHVRNLDVRTQTLTIEGWIHLQWHDNGLKWADTKWKNIDSLRVPYDQIYSPDIMAYNGVDYTTPKLLPTNTIVYSSGLVMWIPPVTHEALCQLDLKRWPYDRHICFLKFGSWTHDGYRMDLFPLNTTNNFLDDFWKSTEFDIKYHNVTREVKYYPCCPNEPYPSITFYFELIRKPNLYHYMISVPSLVAIISSAVAFWLPIRSNARFLLNGFSLLTLTLLLLYLGTQLGFSSLGVPIAVRFLSATTLMVGIIEIWFITAYNLSLLRCGIPLWTSKLTKPVLRWYRNSEHESIQLTQSETNSETSKKISQPTAEDLTFIIDKMAMIIFAIALVVSAISF